MEKGGKRSTQRRLRDLNPGSPILDLDAQSKRVIRIERRNLEQRPARQPIALPDV